MFEFDIKYIRVCKIDQVFQKNYIRISDPKIGLNLTWLDLIFRQICNDYLPDISERTDNFVKQIWMMDECLDLIKYFCKS